MSELITKEIRNLEVQYGTEDFNAFIETLNQISKEVGGVSNLGVFCDITKVTLGYSINCNAKEDFIHVTTKEKECPDRKMKNDGSSIEPYDYSFDELLSKQNRDAEETEDDYDEE